MTIVMMGWDTAVVSLCSGSVAGQSQTAGCGLPSVSGHPLQSPVSPTFTALLLQLYYISLVKIKIFEDVCSFDSSI